VVEGVRPQVDGGRYPVKRALGDEVLVEADVFTELRRLRNENRRFDLAILDPPKFAPTAAHAARAARAYKDINLLALKLLAPGGLLATFSCSHHVSPALFEDVCRAAAEDVGRPVRVDATFGQARDHPVLLAAPETRYLTGLFLEVLE